MMIRRGIVVALMAMAIFVGVSRFAVPAGTLWRNSWRLGDFGLGLSFGDRRTSSHYGNRMIAERVVRIVFDSWTLNTNSLDFGDVARLLGPWRGFDVYLWEDSVWKCLTVQTPASFLCCLFLVYPALSITRALLRRRRRRRRGLCIHCGYNLEANVSGTCPECGTAIFGK